MAECSSLDRPREQGIFLLQQHHSANVFFKRCLCLYIADGKLGRRILHEQSGGLETSLEISCVHIVHMTAIPNAKNTPHAFTNKIEFIWWTPVPNICLQTSNQINLQK